MQSFEKQMKRFINLPYEQKRRMGLASHDLVTEQFDKKKDMQETLEKLYGSERDMIKNNLHDKFVSWRKECYA